MFFKLTSNKKIDLYTKKFYIFSSIANLISGIFAFFIIPPIASSLTLFGIFLFIIFLIEGLVKDNFTTEQYNDRYTLKIFYEMCITSIAVFLINESYLLYLPILLSMLYLNVNTVIKSKLIKYSSIIFMLTPLYKIIELSGKELIQYVSVCILFISLTILTNLLFKSHQEYTNDIERKENVLKEVYKLIQKYTMHNIRNELSRLYLSTIKYHDNYPEYISILQKCSENIQKFANTYAFDNDEKINLETIFDDLDNFVHSPNLNCYNSFIDRKTITGNRNFIYSIIRSILKYCQEKAMYNNIVADVNIVKRENLLIIKDDCGHLISEEFNNFLKIINDEDVKRLFKFNFEYSETSSGNKFKITFLES